ncbi:Ankyrin repeat domain-containing 50 [Fusarium albosuccineum]|uniref:Ankyrin repeat domain-containing 50 n=1 Tax=Fusarium albosuccineum TaxID=1237068 RepID=A0A8H4PM52_9HYPO|nr:Ankyrin repeat domain-containing 50 [Fusarium albosuccineum]
MRSSSALPVANATQDIGLKVIHEAETAEFDIVFVHGFNGHRERTWTYKCDEPSPSSHQDGLADRPSLLEQVASYRGDRARRNVPRKEVFWPRDLLPSTIPNARVMVFGYDTKVHHVLKRPRSESTVYDHARALLMDLSVVRSTHDYATRPIIFIAHSLGGIVVKEALRQSKSMQSNTANRELHTIFRSTIGVLFFGTPHAGADPRDWLAHVAEKAIRAAGYTANQQVVDTLLPGSDRLQELRDEFPMIVEERSLWIMSFRETVGMSILGGKKESSITPY